MQPVWGFSGRQRKLQENERTAEELKRRACLTSFEAPRLASPFADIVSNSDPWFPLLVSLEAHA